MNIHVCKSVNFRTAIDVSATNYYHPDVLERYYESLDNSSTHSQGHSDVYIESHVVYYWHVILLWICLTLWTHLWMCGAN